MLNGFVIARRRVNAGGGPGPVSGVCVDWYVRVCGARVDCAWRGGVGFDVPAVRLALFEQFGVFCKFASLQVGRINRQLSTRCHKLDRVAVLGSTNRPKPLETCLLWQNKHPGRSTVNQEQVCA